VNRDGKLLFANHRLASIFGYADSQEILDLPSIDALFAPHERERLKGYREARLRGEDAPCAYEFEGLTRNGLLVWLENRTTVVVWDGQPAILSAMVDISDRHRTEEQLIQAQKMEVVGQLAGGTAHDFNNLLQVIQANLELISLETAGDEKTLPFVESAMGAVRRGAKLSEQLLSFSRQQTLHPEVVEPTGLIEETVGMLRRTLGEDIEINVVSAPDCSSIRIDSHGLENAVLNLAINARTAMPEGGKLLIRTANRHLDNETPVAGRVLAAGDYVEISVTDNGCGMSPEVMAHAFEPFFTTKDVGKGSGLGLSMVYGFVLQSEGHVELESEVGRGTTVRMTFPAVIAKTNFVRDRHEETALKANTAATVLVVEDDPDVRNSVVMILRKLGHDTLEAENGAVALDILGRESGIDLLFTDLVMPGGMSGIELAEEASRRHKNIKVLLTSGYPEKLLKEKGRSGVNFSLLGKPYSNAALREAIQSILFR
jgi:PAS domain S-box-containing protein